MTSSAPAAPAHHANPLGRRVFAEFLGTGLVVTVVVGSGIAAQQLSPTDVGLQLLENSTATVFGLAGLILMLGPVSGAHFNPVVSIADWFLGRRSGSGMALRDVGAYVIAQVIGAIGGAVLANVMFSVGQHVSTTHRASGGHLTGEVVATAGLIVLIFALARTHRGALSAQRSAQTSAPRTGSPAPRPSPTPPSPSAGSSPTPSPVSRPRRSAASSACS